MPKIYNTIVIHITWDDSVFNQLTVFGLMTTLYINLPCVDLFFNPKRETSIRWNYTRLVYGFLKVIRYSVLVILLILVELGCAAFIFFDKSWEEVSFLLIVILKMVCYLWSSCKQYEGCFRISLPTKLEILI